MAETCTKDNPRLPFLCNCKACCRGAAASWMAAMDRVYAGEITLDEAQRLDEGRS